MKAHAYTDHVWTVSRDGQSTRCSICGEVWQGLVKQAPETQAETRVVDPHTGDSTDVRAHVLDEAKRVVLGAWQQAYGKPERNFARIADLWAAYWRGKGTAIEITGADVALMCVLLKVARLEESPQHADSWVDIAGYAAAGADAAGVEVK